MVALTLPASLASSAGVSTEVFCSQCSHELERWEVHLLKELACPCCGAAVELGATVRIAVPLD
jgi:hypothetical protein